MLLGLSGCGKSTMLRLVAGLDAPDGGRILIGDRDVTAPPPSRRDLSMVFQNSAPFPPRRAREDPVRAREAMSMADRVVLMRKARPPEALYARPATLFAARFTGASPMNFLRMEARDGGGAIVPLAIILALAMAVLVDGSAPGRGCCVRPCPTFS